MNAAYRIDYKALCPFAGLTRVFDSDRLADSVANDRDGATEANVIENFRCPERIMRPPRFRIYIRPTYHTYVQRLLQGAAGGTQNREIMNKNELLTDRPSTLPLVTLDSRPRACGRRCACEREKERESPDLRDGQVSALKSCTLTRRLSSDRECRALIDDADFARRLDPNRRSFNLP